MSGALVRLGTGLPMGCIVCAETASGKESVALCRQVLSSADKF
jgi:hypothetical protein